MECLSELLVWKPSRRSCRRSGSNSTVPTKSRRNTYKHGCINASQHKIKSSCTESVMSETFIEDLDAEHSATSGTPAPATPLHQLGNIRKKEIVRQCPSKSYAYLSNHVRVNQERQVHGVPLLTRCAILDELAGAKAREMAASTTLLKPYRSECLVEHVERTTSLQLLHQLTMHGIDNPARDCILNARFVKFGMGSARGADGMMYVSQLFQGTPLVKPRTRTCSLDSTMEQDQEQDMVALTKKVFFSTPSFSSSTTQTSTVKNPSTRIVPTIDIQVDPYLLRTKDSKAQLVLARSHSDVPEQEPQQPQLQRRRTIVSTRKILQRSGTQ